MNQNPKVIAGGAKGAALKFPANARPITDRVKQSVFDTLNPYLAGANIVDIYAGSGAMGIEALSRGAERCTFVDNDDEAVELIKQNLITTNLTEQGRVLRKSVDNFLKNFRNQEYNIIFLDPPFKNFDNFELHPFKKIMQPNSILVLKSPAASQLPQLASLPLQHEDTFGTTRIGYYMLE